MFTFKTVSELLISLQIIIVSTMVPVFISIPNADKTVDFLNIPISWQVPAIILISIIFESKVVFKAFSIYLLLGLFFIPVFHHGGSLGYLLTSNFGYLLGIYPLIKIIDILKKKTKELSISNL